ncbi:MAG TPA: hypothetical protein PK821_05960 [Victivallales bacterium]|nr:hypothetical protein [Victivallales bacterium]
MKIENAKIAEGFLETTLGVCSGTDVFSRISKFPFSRTISHFLILSVLCSCIYVLIKAPPLMKTSFAYCDALYRCFGGIKFDSKGMLPIREEAVPKKIKLGKTKVDYIPDKLTEHKIEDSGAINGVIWMPDSLYFWVKKDSKYEYFPLLSGLAKMQSSKGSSRKLESVLDTARKDSFDVSIYQDKEYFDFSEAKIPIFLLVLIIHFGGIIFDIIFSIPLYAVMILTVSSVFGSQILEKIKALNFLSIIIYSSFPAIIIATLYSGLSLPFLDFKTVCFICFSIYTFVVINSLQKKLNPSKEEEDDSDDEIF